ncbi:MAG: PAS domain-containing sensor histidine kinase [Actinobacteria bacterium]|jgi:signal transduction histidine kinase|nr:MAG: PAS domain-containing sensor histidine kinase [Actinomycetota bacterium]
MGKVETGSAQRGVGHAASRSALWLGLVDEFTPHRDAAHARGAVLQQLMLAVVVLVVTAFAIIAAIPGDLTLFFSGVALVFVLTVVTLLVPWDKLSTWAVGAIPLLDIVAILLMRAAFPESGLALLWLFPAMWLSASLGLAGFLAANLFVWASYWWVIAAGQESAFSFALLLLPIVVLVVSAGTYFSVRRFAAQRVLLDKQALVLRQSLERTQHQEELVTQVLDSVDFGVILISADDRVTIVNEANERMQHALIDLDGRDRLPAFDADGKTPLDAERSPVARARRGDVFDNQIVWFGAPDTTRRALSVTARRLRDTQGGDAGAVVISREVTSERTALLARDNVVASVSHELRAPLTAIIGYLDLALETDGIPEKVRGDLDVATQNAERMIQIISDILSATSSSRSTVDVTVSPENVDLQRLVLESAAAWEPTALERRITIFTDDVRPTPAYIDPARMRQVADNLISNAIKYGREGGSVQLAVYGDGVASYLLVRDDGIGLTPDDQNRLFRRFFRARTDVGGTGLGLAICRDIVRAHGGEIIVGSEQGVGSAFLVRLPAKVDVMLPPIDPEEALDMSGAVTTAGRSDMEATG